MRSVYYCVYIYICIYVCIYIYIYICMYIYRERGIPSIYLLHPHVISICFQVSWPDLSPPCPSSPCVRSQVAKFHKSPAQRPSVWGPRGPGGPGGPWGPWAESKNGQGGVDKPKKHEFDLSEPAGEKMNAHKQRRKHMITYQQSAQKDHEAMVHSSRPHLHTGLAADLPGGGHHGGAQFQPQTWRWFYGIGFTMLHHIHQYHSKNNNN